MITSFIPTYKRPEQLKRAIESILNQTHRELKLVVLDNASGDATETVVRGYMKTDPRVHYHCHKQNIGMLGNYAYAFDHIETPYFNILSDDDFVHPWFLETALKDLKDYPDAAYSACAVEALDNENKCVGNSIVRWPKEGYHPTPQAALEMTSAHGKFPMPTGILFRTQLVKGIKPLLTPKMQLLWDPEYVTHIAMRHPIVTNKKTCGIFIANEDSFSSTFYKRLHNGDEDFEKFVIPCMGIIEKIRTSTDIDEKHKINVLNNMKYYVTSFAKALSIRYIRLKKFDRIETILEVIDRYIGADLYLKLLAGLGRLSNKKSTLATLLGCMLKCASPIYRMLRKAKK